MFEVQDLKYATLATVSRCGMVWFSEDVVTSDMCFQNYLRRLRDVPLDEIEAAATVRSLARGGASVPGLPLSTPTADAVKEDFISPNLMVRGVIVKKFF